MKKRNLFLTIIATLALGLSIVIPSANNIGSRAGGGGGAITECEAGHHSGNHYLANAPTATEPGNAEFWACCTCLRQYLTNPGGTFVDQGPYAGPALASTHIAYIAPTGVPSVAINATETSLYITKQLTLTATVTNSEDTVVWSTSNASLATVTNGVVTGVAPGDVTITAALSMDGTVKDEVVLTVLDTVIDGTVNATAWNYEGLYQTNASIKPVVPANVDDIKTYAPFKNVLGKKYVAKAHFNTHAVVSWVWNTLTIGHIRSDGVIYATGFSQGQKKLITQTSKTVGGVEQQWGVLSDRSQIWDQHDLNTLNTSAGVNIMSVRNGGDFYFFINDELYWQDTTSFNDWDEVDTTPVVFLIGVNATVSNLEVATTTEAVNNVLNSAAAKRKLYPTFSQNVVLSENDTKVQFLNADTISTNSKDVAAKSIGDAFMFPANASYKVEYDLVIDKWGTTDESPVVALDLRRQDSDPAETRSFLVGKTGVSFAGWNYNYSLPNGYPAGLTQYHDGATNIQMVENKTYHVVCTRLMDLTQGQDTKIEVYDGELLIATMTHGWRDGYKGNAVIFLSVRNINATLSNITLSAVV